MLMNNASPEIREAVKRALRSAAASFLGFGALAAILLPQAASAATTTWPQDTALSVNGVSLTIVSGSQSDSLSVDATTVVVTVGAAEQFQIRSDAGYALPNNGGLAQCTVSGSNDPNTLTVTGAATVTFTPGTTPCGPTGGGGSPTSTATPSVTLLAPMGGGSYAAGSATQIAWQTSNSNLSSVRLLLSTDSGAAYGTTIAAGLSNSGSYSWTVPASATTHARVKIEIIDFAGAIISSSASNGDFTITVAAAAGSSPAPSSGASSSPAPAAQPAANATSGLYSTASETASAPDINTDKSLVEKPAASVAKCVGGSLIKGSKSTVYYCGRDGKRYGFPNPRIYYSWYPDFSTVVTISDADLATLPLGGNVTYRPGKRMIKIQSDPKTYVVSRGGLLRWVTSEQVAKALYGVDWNKQIDDVDVSLFVNYKLGEPVSDAQVGTVL